MVDAVPACMLLLLLLRPTGGVREWMNTAQDVVVPVSH